MKKKMLLLPLLLATMSIYARINGEISAFKPTIYYADTAEMKIGEEEIIKIEDLIIEHKRCY